MTDESLAKLPIFRGMDADQRHEALSMAQRVLSNRVRGLRREARTAHGSIEYRDGRVQAITMTYLLADSEAALRLMGASIALMATGWLLAGL